MKILFLVTYLAIYYLQASQDESLRENVLSGNISASISISDNRMTLLAEIQRERDQNIRNGDEASTDNRTTLLIEAQKERDQAIRERDEARRELELIRRMQANTAQGAVNDSLPITQSSQNLEPKAVFKAGFNTDNSEIYNYSESFVALNEPWSNPQLLQLKERISGELLAAALTLSKNSEKALLIKAAADLSLPAACFYHYHGIRDGEYGFTKDQSALSELWNKYREIKLKNLQRLMQNDLLDSLLPHKYGENADAYIEKLLTMAAAGSEVAIHRHLRTLHLAEILQTSSSSYPLAPIESLKKKYRSVNLIDEAKQYVVNGSESALLWLFYASHTPNETRDLVATQLVGAYRSIVFPFDVVKEFCTIKDPSLMQTEMFKYLDIADKAQRFNWWNAWGSARNNVSSSNPLTETQENFNKTIRGYADQGVQIARGLLLNSSQILPGVIPALRCDRFAAKTIITTFAKQGCKVGQRLCISSIMHGDNGFEKDEKLVRKLMVEYGIFRPMVNLVFGVTSGSSQFPNFATRLDDQFVRDHHAYGEWEIF
jgi:hypothetical protein